MPDAGQLRDAYAHCRRVTRAAARNFYYGILLLPSPKRHALCALYAFMRRADDLSDQPGTLPEKQAGLAAWRSALDRALSGDSGGSPVLLALHDTVARYGIPPGFLHNLISGTEMDLSISRYPTFERLREYCYHVAGTVGLCCIHVFGFSDPRAPELAERMGIAFQLTNILRDVPRDLAMGRIYLPKEDLERFGCPEADTGRWPASPGFRELVRFETERAWGFFQEGRELIPLISKDSRAALWALARIYSGILEKIEARDYDVFREPPVGLSAAEKLRTWARARLGFWPDDFQERGGDRRGTGGAFLRRRAG